MGLDPFNDLTLCNMHSGIITLTPIYCDNLGKEAITIKSAKKTLRSKVWKLLSKLSWLFFILFCKLLWLRIGDTSEGHRSRGRGMGDPITRGENESGVRCEPWAYLTSHWSDGVFSVLWLADIDQERRCADALMRSTCSVRLRLWRRWDVRGLELIRMDYCSRFLWTDW